jgi:hypothetical protein
VTNSFGDEALVLLVVLILGLAMRWAFRSSRPRTAHLSGGSSDELGLLVVISTELSRTQAMTMRAELGDAGIRSSMSHRRNGRLDVLVFRDDVTRAKALLRLP